MTIFEKSKFNFDGMYLEYEGRFIARFKYMRSNVPGFRSFLIKNFTVEEYFQRRAREEAPLDILKSKGYVSNSYPQVAHRGRVAAHSRRTG